MKTHTNITSSPRDVKLSWQHSYISIFYMTSKPSKLGQTDLIFSFWSEFISRSVHAGLQVPTCSGYNLCRPG